MFQTPLCLALRSKKGEKEKKKKKTVMVEGKFSLDVQWIEELYFGYYFTRKCNSNKKRSMS